MPRKRRKLSLTDRSADIPFSKVRVEWVDCVSDSGWASDKEFDKMTIVLSSQRRLVVREDR